MSPVAQERVPIVAAEHFVLATRDTGYRSVAAAVAELIDNSLQANARRIDVIVSEFEHSPERSALVGVLDDGSGMSPATLECALQFGGTHRFDDRSGLGRFGMGLPNSSVSHSRRLEVYSWQRPSEIYHTYLDVDEVAAGRLRFIPTPRRASLPPWVALRVGRSGTLVLWTRCDRLGRHRVDTLVRRMEATLGRVYRYPIWSGTHIAINGARVQPFDPLFMHETAAVRGARAHGGPLRYELSGPAGPSVIEVRFSELPVQRWHRWPAEEKRQKGVVGGAGISILRARRLDASDAGGVSKASLRDRVASGGEEPLLLARSNAWRTRRFSVRAMASRSAESRSFSSVFGFTPCLLWVTPNNSSKSGENRSSQRHQSS